MSELDLEIVRHALGLARANGFAEVELAVGENSFSASLAPGAPAGVGTPTSSSPDAVPAEPPLSPIKATLVGYYREAKVPLADGQTVQKGDVVAVIVALGLANDVESTVSGEVVEVLVQPESPVEYGQPLALVRTS